MGELLQSVVTKILFGVRIRRYTEAVVNLEKGRIRLCAW
jgi:hypothetical protein